MIILISTYLGIWTISLAAFWLFSKGDALGHTIMFLYVVLPVTTLSVSFVIGRNDYCGKWKWVFTIILGIMYMLADYTTFSASNMIDTSRRNLLFLRYGHWILHTSVKNAKETCMSSSLRGGCPLRAACPSAHFAEGA